MHVLPFAKILIVDSDEKVLNTLSMISYDRSTNSALLCALQWMSCIYVTQTINSYLNSKISASHDKGLEF